MTVSVGRISIHQKLKKRPSKLFLVFFFRNRQKLENTKTSHQGVSCQTVQKREKRNFRQKGKKPKTAQPLSQNKKQSKREKKKSSLRRRKRGKKTPNIISFKKKRTGPGGMSGGDETSDVVVLHRKERLQYTGRHSTHAHTSTTRRSPSQQKHAACISSK